MLLVEEVGTDGHGAAFESGDPAQREPGDGHEYRRRGQREQEPIREADLRCLWEDDLQDSRETQVRWRADECGHAADGGRVGHTQDQRDTQPSGLVLLQVFAERHQDRQRHRHHHHRGRGIADPHGQEPGRQHEPQHDIRSAGAE